MRLHSLRRKTKGKIEMEGVLELYIKTRVKTLQQGTTPFLSTDLPRLSFKYTLTA